jgi:hypothetical protein
MLLMVSALPFPTSILARYGDTFFAVAFYASMNVALSMVATAIRRYAVSKPELIDPVLATGASTGWMTTALTAGVFLVSIGVAAVKTSLAKLVRIGIAFTVPLTDRIASSRRS